METIRLNYETRLALIAEARAVTITHPLIHKAHPNTTPFDVVTCLKRPGSKVMVRKFVLGHNEGDALHKFAHAINNSASLRLCFVSVALDHMEPGVADFVRDTCCNQKLHAFVA